MNKKRTIIRSNTPLLAPLAIVPLVVSLTGCGSGSSSKSPEASAKSKPKAEPVLVELATVARGEIEELVERSAPLEAESQVPVRARTQNPVIELFVEEGDSVVEGQVLVRLENDRQKADHDRSKILLEKARIAFDQQKKLFDQDLASDLDYRTARYDFEQAELQVEDTRRALEFTEVRAPIKGTISQRMVRKGDQVTTESILFEIVDLESTVAVINVPEQYLRKLKPKMEARLSSGTLGERTFLGSVKRLAPVVDARAGTIKVVVELKEIGPLRPGMWVDVELVLSARPDALLIPKRAIVYDNDRTFAYKAITDDKGVLRAQRVPIALLNTDKEHVEPVDGFEVGERIVVAGHSGLKDNALIRELTSSEEPASTSP